LGQAQNLRDKISLQVFRGQVGTNPILYRSCAASTFDAKYEVRGPVFSWSTSYVCTQSAVESSSQLLRAS